MDYLVASFQQYGVTALAVEKLVDLDVPERAQIMRVIVPGIDADFEPYGLAGNASPRHGGDECLSVLLP